MNETSASEVICPLSNHTLTIGNISTIVGRLPHILRPSHSSAGKRNRTRFLKIVNKQTKKEYILKLSDLCRHKMESGILRIKREKVFKTKSYLIISISLFPVVECLFPSTQARY